MKGETSKASISRIPALQFEAFMSGILQRMEQPAEQLRLVVHRIDICAQKVVVHLNRKDLISTWRAGSAERGSQTVRQIIDARRKLLATGETLSGDGEHLILSLPIRAQFRGGAAAVLDPIGAATPQPDVKLIKAVARAHTWRKMLLDGEVTSIEALAKRFGLDRGHVGRTLNLAFLSPALTRAIVRGEQPLNLRLTRLLNAEIPLSWREQESVFMVPSAAR